MADEPTTPPTLPNPLPSSSEGGSRRTLIIYAIIGGAILLIVLLIKRNAQNVTTPAATSKAPAPITINEPIIPTEAADTVESGEPTETPPKPKPPTPVKEGPLPPVRLPKRTVNPPTPTKAAPPKKTPEPVEHARYTVEAGDTLAEIAARHGVSLQALYEANKATVDSWAEAHGHKPPYENWIFPGEILTIP